MRGSVERGFVHGVAASQSVWILRDESGAALPAPAGRVRVEPYWSSAQRARAMIGCTPDYAYAQPVEIPWPEFRDRILPELQAEGALVGVNWERLDGSGLSLAPERVLQAIETDIGRFGAGDPVRRRYVQDARLGAAIGAFYGVLFALEWHLSLRVALWTILMAPLGGALLALELRSRAAWETRGVVWSLARYLLAVAGTALVIYSLGSWWLYPWSLARCAGVCVLAGLAGALLWVITHSRDYRYPPHAHKRSHDHASHRKPNHRHGH